MGTLNRTGYQTSELHLIAGALAYLWHELGSDPALLVWPTAAILIAYILARAAVKVAGVKPAVGSTVLFGQMETQGEGFAAGAPGSAPVPPASPAPDSPTGGTLAQGAKALAVLALFLGLMAAPSCKATWQALSEPKPLEPVTVVLEDGTEVTGMPAAEDAPADVEVTLPDGAGTATYTPPAANPNPSALEQIAGAAGAAAGTATGLPWLAFLVPALVGLVTRRNQPAIAHVR
jgi:hypothetical protein